MKEVGYETVAKVLETWDSVRRCHKSNFEQDFGKIWVDKFVELQPRSKTFYGFKENEAKGEIMMAKHAEGIVHLFDSILQMLGPDVEFMEEILSQVGERHVKMGISVSFFPFLGNALIWAIQKDIGDEMTDEHIEAWEAVYDAISGEIVKAILNSSSTS